MSSHARIGRLIQSLRDALSTQKPPYCAGTAQIPQDQYTLFYGPTGNAQYVKLSNYRRDNIEYSLFTNINTISRIDLSRAAESELANLSASCEPATFGVDQKDVLDESYRKARKLDVADFATKFELHKSKIMDVVRAALLEGHDSNRPVEAELYKLNVYGELVQRICSSRCMSTA
jgi:hypothetical protein